MFLLLSTGCQFTGCLILGKKRRITEQNTSTSLKAFLHFGLLYLGHRETRADRNHSPPPPSFITFGPQMTLNLLFTPILSSVGKDYYNFIQFSLCYFGLTDVNFLSLG